MSVERKFIQEGINGAQIKEHLLKRLSRAGYGGLKINRTPMGTQITVAAEKPGIVIGKSGGTIRKLTGDLETMFHLENPQIDVQEIVTSELNAQVMATVLANALERGIYFRKAGHNMLRRIMEAGALGCEIVISGKLTGSRSRVGKFVAGNILHAGNPVDELVDKGFATAIKKLGTLGCSVRIIPPDVELPGQFQAIPRKIEEVASVEPEKAVVVEKKIEEPPKATETKVEETPKKVEETPKKVEETTETKVEEIPETFTDQAGEERRMHGDVLEHKHKGYEYWHPVTRVHKMEVN
ncbi:30S ribosomal protein S3 [Methanosarcinales archaeon]|nr:MAG: 30S ribosomal protein S3 [Methanosarcinales archaeon]